MHISYFLFQPDSTCYLKVGETINLCRTQQLLVQSIDIVLLQRLINIDDVFQFFQEPFVNLGEFVYLIYCIILVHSLRYDENTLVGRFTESSIKVFNLEFLVLNKAMHALPNHAKSFLNSFFKVTTNSHNFTDRLHT